MLNTLLRHNNERVLLKGLGLEAVADPGGFLWLQWKPPFKLLDLAASRAAVWILAKLHARAYAHCLHHNYDCATSTCY